MLFDILVHRDIRARELFRDSDPFPIVIGTRPIGSSDLHRLLHPGVRIGNASRTLPDVATVEDDTREVTLDVPGRFEARVTFRRFYFRRRTMAQWLWTAESAVEV